MYGYKHYRFSLSIDRDTLLSVNQGAVKRIRVRTDEGMVADLDANHLKEFTSEDGIHGRFPNFRARIPPASFTLDIIQR